MKEHLPTDYITGRQKTLLTSWLPKNSNNFFKKAVVVCNAL